MSSSIGRRPAGIRRKPGALVVLLTAVSLAATGCSSDKDPAPSRSPGSTSSGAPAASVRLPDGCTTVVGGADSAALAASVSEALFASAPVVVVAPAVDGPELRAAADEARRIGAPLLLDGGGAAPGTPGATAEPDATTEPDTTAEPDDPAEAADSTDSTDSTDSAGCAAPAPTATPIASYTPAPTETESPAPTETESPAPTETESPAPTETESPAPTETEALEPAGTATPGATSEAASAEPSASTPPSDDPSPEPIEAAPPVPSDAITSALPCSPPAFSVPPATPTPSATPSGTGTPFPGPTDEPSGTPSPSAPPQAIGTAVPEPSTAPADRPAAREIERLEAKIVLATTPQIAADLRAALTDVKIVESAGDLPATSLPAPLSALAVLVDADDDPRTLPGAIAASATAQAAGARAVAVQGDDPRADGCAVSALSAAKPERVLAAGAGFGPAGRLADRMTVVVGGIQLPGGGQVFFPGRRLVALYGHPGAPELGVMGAQSLSASIERAKRVAEPYISLSDVPVVPTFEIIATTAQGVPGSDGDYSGESAVDKLRPWVEAAGRAGMYVVLDLQPGRDNALSQAKIYTDLLKLPHVGLAIDPEWKLTGSQRPLGQIGSIGMDEVNSVGNWLADLTAEYNLPQKLLVLHQFTQSMLRDRSSLNTSHDELAVLIHMDGQGEPVQKDATWKVVTTNLPDNVTMGWKNFYKKDTRTLSAAETMTKKPTPVMISYQ